MLGSFFAWLGNLFRNVLMMFGFGTSAIKRQLQVFVKTNTGEKISLSIDPSWNIQRIKAELGPQLKAQADDLRIIFAGKELLDTFIIEECDLGQHSILHAVRVIKKGEEVKAKVRDNLSKEEPTVSKLEVNPPQSTAAKEITTGKAPQNFPLCDTRAVITIQLSEEERNRLALLRNQGNEQGERAHFYVYCSTPCRSVCVGKLRVRCAVCGQGAITLKNDPCSWRDVLTPYAIEADCQQTGCSGSTAQFFFKCAKHETTGESDTAVALYLVRANLRCVPCLACTDVSSPVLVFECADAHVICLDCFVTYCVSRLNERQFTHNPEIGYTLPCLTGCPNSLIKEIHHFKLMGEEQYERYQRFGAEECVLAAGGVFCPRPGCGNGIVPDEDCRRIVCSGDGRGGCGYVFCRFCLQGFHIGDCQPEAIFATPEEAAGGFTFDPERAAASRWDEATGMTIRVSTKPCPRCRTPTERDGGCMHMVCTRAACGFHWCWVCQTEWTRNCMSAHWFG